MWKTRRKSSTERGFTLLEVLIAFAIAAMALAALFGGTVGGLNATEVSARYAEALSLARSHVAAVGRGEAIAQLDTSGAEGEGFTWHLSIHRVGTRPLNQSDNSRANDENPSSAILFDVVATESWKDGSRTRQVSVATRRVDVQSTASLP